MRNEITVYPAMVFLENKMLKITEPTHDGWEWDKGIFLIKNHKNHLRIYQHSNTFFLKSISDRCVVLSSYGEEL